MLPLALKPQEVIFWQLQKVCLSEFCTCIKVGLLYTFVCGYCYLEVCKHFPIMRERDVTSDNVYILFEQECEEAEEKKSTLKRKKDFFF